MKVKNKTYIIQQYSQAFKSASMFSLTNTQKILQINSPLYSPIQIDDSLLICSYNGEIIKYAQGQLKLLTKINGQIRSIAFDTPKNTFYIADLLKQSIIAVNANDFSEAQLVNQYEGQLLQGPNSILISNKTGNVFFTDSGPLGQTHIPNAKGSVFIIDMQQQSIRPIVLRCLSGPSGLAFSNDEKVLYVSQTGKNRLLRFYQSQQGVYYSSVFHQFQGRFGPTALAVTNTGHIIVALFQFNSLSTSGCVGIVNSQGDLKQKIKLPQCGPQISGLFISRENADDMMVLITQNGTRSNCHRLMIKIDKEEEHEK